MTRAARTPSQGAPSRGERASLVRNRPTRGRGKERAPRCVGHSRTLCDRILRPPRFSTAPADGESGSFWPAEPIETLGARRLLPCRSRSNGVTFLAARQDGSMKPSMISRKSLAISCLLIASRSCRRARFAAPRNILPTRQLGPDGASKLVLLVQVLLVSAWTWGQCLPRWNVGTLEWRWWNSANALNNGPSGFLVGLDRRRRSAALMRERPRKSDGRARRGKAMVAGPTNVRCETPNCTERSWVWNLVDSGPASSLM